jgi:methionyl-tRNA formyltransferase
MKKLRIVFMGTPEFAVGILDTIVKNNFEVVGVITATDKPAGRGQKIKYSAVKEYALEKGLEFFNRIKSIKCQFTNCSSVQNATKSSLGNARIRHL